MTAPIPMRRCQRDVWPDSERAPGMYDVEKFRSADVPAATHRLGFIEPGGEFCSVLIGPAGATGDLSRGIPHVWQWNGDADCPTLIPSIVDRVSGWHGFITAGQLRTV